MGQFVSVTYALLPKCRPSGRRANINHSVCNVISGSYLSLKKVTRYKIAHSKTQASSYDKKKTYRVYLQFRPLSCIKILR